MPQEIPWCLILLLLVKANSLAQQSAAPTLSAEELDVDEVRIRRLNVHTSTCACLQCLRTRSVVLNYARSFNWPSENGGIT